MTPTLVTPPASLPVTLAEAKEHLRVDHDNHNSMISDLIAEAVAWLDGYGGILGRAIMQQTWAVTVDAAGDYVLPMPDVTEASIDGSSLTITATALGPMVTTNAAGVIEFTCSLPEYRLPIARSAVKEHVRRAYDQLSGQEADASTLMINMAVSNLHWPRL